jgi:hypothetical protein
MPLCPSLVLWCRGSLHMFHHYVERWVPLQFSLYPCRMSVRHLFNEAASVLVCLFSKFVNIRACIFHTFSVSAPVLLRPRFFPTPLGHCDDWTTRLSVSLRSFNLRMVMPTSWLQSRLIQTLPVPPFSFVWAGVNNVLRSLASPQLQRSSLAWPHFWNSFCRDPELCSNGWGEIAPTLPQHYPAMPKLICLS